MNHHRDPDLRFIELVHDDKGVSPESRYTQWSPIPRERVGELGDKFNASLELVEEVAA